MNKLLFELLYVVFFTTRLVGILVAAFILLITASFVLDYFAGRSPLLP